MRKPLFALAVVAVLSLGAVSVALSQSGHWDVMPVEGQTGPELTGRAAARVAMLRLPTGGSLEFVDLGGGEIGVGERAPGAQPLVSVAMSRKWGATPLEIFTALAPEESRTPDALTSDHDAYLRRSGQNPAPPRDLRGGSPMLDLGDPGVDYFDCDHLGNNFRTDWHDTFDGVMDHVHAGFIHGFFYEGYFNFYPGGYYNADGSVTPGHNQVTYLGACNGDDDNPFTVQIQRRIAYVNPPNTTYMWAVVVNAVILNDNEKYTFFSNVPGIYRGRVLAEGTVDHLGVAVAYNKGFPKTVLPEP